MEGKDGGRKGSGAFKVGGICLAFLVMGYQAAVFVHKAAVLQIAKIRDHPDTVYVVEEKLASRILQAGDAAEGAPGMAAGGRGGGELTVRRDAPGSAAGRRGGGDLAVRRDVSGGAAGGRGGGEMAVRRDAPDEAAGNSGALVVRRNAVRPPAAEAVRSNRRRVESFRFNPNTVSVADLQRLGFSEKQAMSIDAYRRKGGRFRRKSDFARSYVVADSVYRRLERYIDIPRVDINAADSADFDALPGIGPWFAARMVAYREELGGYSYPEQLMDIYRFDREKYDGLKDLIRCSGPAPFRLWSLPADSLRSHPYIRSWTVAKAIVLYREHTPASERSVEGLGRAGILPDSLALKLARCKIE